VSVRNFILDEQQLYSSWTKRSHEVSLLYHHVDKKQLTTSEKNQSSPAIWCKTLFYGYIIQSSAVREDLFD